MNTLRLRSICVEWLFGSQYQGMADMLRWLCLAVPFLSLRFAAANILMAQNRPWLRARARSPRQGPKRRR